MEYKERSLEKRIDKLWNEKEMIVIKGPRQAGKTTLLKHLKEKYGGSYYTLEDDDVLRLFNAKPDMLIDDDIIFFDEVQLSPIAGKQLKLLYDKYESRVKFVVSGSGAFDIKRMVGSFLVGRAFFLTLLPLSFEEFVRWKDGTAWKILVENKRQLIDFIKTGKIPDPLSSESLREMAYEYMVWGGYPSVVLTRDREIKKEKLKNIVELTVERDLARLFNLKDIGKIKKVSRTLSTLIGRTLKLTSLNVDFKTAEFYTAILQHSGIIALLESFHRNERTAIRKAKKLYFYDLGFRNALLNNFTDIEARENKGFLIENFVFRELIESFDLKYWRTTKEEVDFVIEEPLTGIEVKSSLKKPRGIMKFMEKYRCKGIVLTDEFKKNEVLYYPFWFA